MPTLAGYGEKAIPILPCPSIPDVVAFYQALGFEVTHLQTRPTDAERASLSDDLGHADDLRESLRS